MSQLNIATLANLAGSETTPIADVVNGSARAWVNFNGTGTVAIRTSYNVSSITDNGTGNYAVNFTNAMPDADYLCVGSAAGAPANGSARNLSNADARTTSSVFVFVHRLYTSTVSVAIDSQTVSVAIFR